MEICAAVAGLELLKQPCRVTLYRDSQKLVKVKLQREMFSDANIARALADLRTLFPATYA